MLNMCMLCLLYVGTVEVDVDDSSPSKVSSLLLTVSLLKTL